MGGLWVADLWVARLGGRWVAGLPALCSVARLAARLADRSEAPMDHRLQLAVPYRPTSRRLQQRHRRPQLALRLPWLAWRKGDGPS